MGANTRVAFHHSNGEGRESEADEAEPRVLALSVPQDWHSQVDALQDRDFILNSAPGAFSTCEPGLSRAAA